MQYVRWWRQFCIWLLRTIRHVVVTGAIGIPFGIMLTTSFPGGVVVAGLLVVAMTYLCISEPHLVVIGFSWRKSSE